MKIKTNVSINGYDGLPIKDGDKDVQLKTVLINCLNYEDQAKKMTHEEKFRAYVLSLEITAKDEVELKAEDIVIIKNNALKLYHAVVYGQLVKALGEN